MIHQEAKNLIDIYGKAWETKDVELVASIFTDNATYDDPKEPENIGIEAIKEYWKSKVVDGQEDIKFEIKNVWVDGATVIAEWHATFKDIIRNLYIDMTEVAIFTVSENKFSSLREYYKTIKTPII